MKIGTEAKWQHVVEASSRVANRTLAAQRSNCSCALSLGEPVRSILEGPAPCQVLVARKELH